MTAPCFVKLGSLVLCGMMMLHALGEVRAQSPESDAAKKTLADQNFPWYDSETGKEKAVAVSADPNETGQRDSTWLGSGDWQQSSTTTRRTMPSMGAFGTIVQIIVWFLIALGLLGLSYLVIMAFMKMDAKQVLGGGEDVEDEEEDRTRIENLPFQVKRPNANLLEEAQACYNRGEYNDAIIYLYSHQLIELDRRQAIHLTKGKTNRQYVRELRERPKLSNILEASVLLFEEAFFGRHTITRQQIDRCWNQLPDFQRELGLVTA
jgi:hypothetical protein